MAKRILFQGDSITDWGRSRENLSDLGLGYPQFVRNALGTEYPNEYEFLNRGVSGNRVVDLYSRIKIDLINLKPDYLSIYIGVNDVWHEIDNQNGVDAEKFEKIYTMLIDEVVAALPNLKFMLIAPFILEGSGTMSTEENPYKFEHFKKEVKIRADICKKLACKYNVPCIDTQKAFDEALKKADDSYWCEDGVHPTVFGHQILKDLWLKAFEEIK